MSRFKLATSPYHHHRMRFLMGPIYRPDWDALSTVADGECATCDSPDMGFKDTHATDAYIISGMCQSCQDSVFGKDDKGVER